MKIVSLLKLYMTDEQLNRIRELGEYEVIKESRYSEDTLYNLLSKADVIIAKKKFLKYKRIYDLKNKFIIIPFGKEDFWRDLDTEKLREKKIIIKHIPRRYEESLGEWVIFMMILMMRRIGDKINTTEKDISKNLEMGRSLYGKNVTILGEGVVGKRVEQLCRAFGMNVTIYRRFDDIKEKTKDADVIINCLKNYPGDPPILTENFFNSLKKGVLFISPASNSTYDLNALKMAIKKGIIAGIADDVTDTHIGSPDSDIYRELLSIESSVVTPHIAWRTDIEAEITFNKVIKYIESIKNGNEMPE